MQICSLKFYKSLNLGRGLLPLVAALLVIAPAGHALAAGKKPAAKHATVTAKAGSARTAGKPALAKSTASRHSSVASARGKGAARLAAAAKGRGAVHLATRQKHERQRTVLAGKGAAHASSKLERSRAERPAAVAATMPGLRIHSVRFEDAGGTRLSVGRESGVGEFSSRASSDPLDLKSSVALVIDQDTKEVLLAKNDHAVQPIASLTKLMTGLIMSEAHLPLDEMITISEEDIDTITALSGCGPAFISFFLKALEDAAVGQGLEKDVARSLLFQTLAGTYEYLRRNGDTYTDFITKVSSKGGATLAGLKTAEYYDIERSICEMVRAATDRSRELAEE